MSNLKIIGKHDENTIAQAQNVLAKVCVCIFGIIFTSGLAVLAVCCIGDIIARRGAA